MSRAWDRAGGSLLNVISEDLWKLQKILHSKKASLGIGHSGVLALHF